MKEVIDTGKENRKNLKLVGEPVMVRIENLSKFFNTKRALDGINLELPKGRIIGLLGPNGSGKSTLLRIMAGFCADYEGSVLIDEKSPGTAESRAEVAYLPDRDGLPENLTVEEIISIYKEFFADFDELKCRELLENFNISENATTKEMSKGVIDKLQISMLMSRKAKLYLLDEPIGGVDVEARKLVLDLILENFNPEGTMLIATHLVRDIERLFDSAIVLKDGRVAVYDDSDTIREAYGGTLEDALISIFKGE